MKKLLLSILVIAVPLFGLSQSAFDKYTNSDKVGSISINKSMLGIVAQMSANDGDQESKDFIELAKSIEDINVFVSEDATASADMAMTMKRYIKKAKLEEMMKVRDGDTRVSFYIKNGKKEGFVKELLMFVTGIDKDSGDSPIETVLVTMTGNIDLNKVGALTNKMNLPKELKKAEGKK
ncbi:MAG: DUF4252 domain-containing protein [Croceitalea sp.]|nr:DUF4252 domain-containing protein [Croceitalea sp.]NNL07692.1 DUF4252 domain-containing protein [Croceitalea sp.]NNM19149.1 DUF4252 domain-containing protein [Croceitalea sp.]